MVETAWGRMAALNVRSSVAGVDRGAAPVLLSQPLTVCANATRTLTGVLWMKQVPALDASMFYADTDVNRMQGGLLMIVDPSGMGELDLPRLKEHVGRRANLVGALKRYPRFVKWRMDHPYWVMQDQVDIDKHWRVEALPGPGTRDQLMEKVGQHLQDPFPPETPLWEIMIFTGLEDGRFAALLRGHHAPMDGLAAMMTLQAVMDFTPDQGFEPVPVPVADDGTPEAPDDASQRMLMARGLKSLGWRLTQIFKFYWQLIQTVTRMRRYRKTHNVKLDKAPRTQFNGMHTKGRETSIASVPFTEVKAIKDAAGVTVNDVVLAAIGGGLRAYLLERDQLPDSSLVALLPANTRANKEKAESNNRLSFLLGRTGSHLENPRERVAYVNADTKRAKDEFEAIGIDLLSELSDANIPWFTRGTVVLHEKVRLSEKTPPLYNVHLSNTPGLPVPLFLAGARLDELYIMGPLMIGMGMAISVISFNGQMCMSMVGDTGLVDDTARLMELVVDAHNELLAEFGDSGNESSRASA